MAAASAVSGLVGIFLFMWSMRRLKDSHTAGSSAAAGAVAVAGAGVTTPGAAAGGSGLRRVPASSVQRKMPDRAARAQPGHVQEQFVRSPRSPRIVSDRKPAPYVPRSDSGPGHAMAAQHSPDGRQPMQPYGQFGQSPSFYGGGGYQQPAAYSPGYPAGVPQG